MFGLTKVCAQGNHEEGSRRVCGGVEEGKGSDPGPAGGRGGLVQGECLPPAVCWSVLLAPVMPTLVPLLRLEKDLAATDAQAVLVVGMNGATRGRLINCV